MHAARWNCVYFSSSFSFSGSKVSSHPTSTSSLMPPSSSNIDWTAEESDLAPCRGVNVNMLLSNALGRSLLLFVLGRGGYTPLLDNWNALELDEMQSGTCHPHHFNDTFTAAGKRQAVGIPYVRPAPIRRGQDWYVLCDGSDDQEPGSRFNAAKFVAVHSKQSRAAATLQLQLRESFSAQGPCCGSPVQGCRWPERWELPASAHPCSP